MASPLSSTALLERFRRAHGKDINLTLRNAYSELLAALGNPHKNLPPTLIVAGTNGKGSTCAFLRAMIEAEGKSVHVYTSPHLLTFHERIRLAGDLISEEELVDFLLEIEKVAKPGAVSLFEIITAAALTAFARYPADAAILEVGLGGRLDATNITPHPVGCAISHLSFDHCDYLGHSMAEIAREKAGIMRKGTPCYAGRQTSPEAVNALKNEADRLHTPLFLAEKDFEILLHIDGTWTFRSPQRQITGLPKPALAGAHQYDNAALAIATAQSLPFPLSDQSIRTAMTSVYWPGRLELLSDGSLIKLLPPGHELWLDGGHNDSAALALAAQMKAWFEKDGKQIDLVYGMLSTKNPADFLAPLAPYLKRVRTLSIQGDVPGFSAEELADQVRLFGLEDVQSCATVSDALQSLSASFGNTNRTLICGSLVLVGDALRENMLG
ncbi:MAG: folylpolyglutamate synthase/dihydrofolate synthase family protein [Bdellovibrionales bacterium]